MDFQLPLPMLDSPFSGSHLNLPPFNYAKPFDQGGMHNRRSLVFDLMLIDIPKSERGSAWIVRCITRTLRTFYITGIYYQKVQLFSHYTTNFNAHSISFLPCHPQLTPRDLPSSTNYHEQFSSRPQ